MSRTPEGADEDPQRAFAHRVVLRLREAGHEALWAGGCVRDQLLGVPPKDYDVATSATPEQVRGVFGARKTLAIGAAFGVITVLGGRGVGQLEVATFRTDLGYTDGRRPDRVVYTTAEHDAQRRDFTINGMFFDPLNHRVLDFVGGQADLAARCVRAIGDPDARFGEDKLRMLRAVRFATTLGFEVDAATLEAVCRLAAGVTVVSVERVCAELARILTHAHRARGVGLLAETGLLAHVLPELAPLSPEGLARRVAVLGALASPSLPLALAALGGESAGEMARRLKCSNSDVKRAAWLIESLPVVARADKLPWSRLQRVLADPHATELLGLHEGIVGGTDAAARTCRERLAAPRAELDPPPLVVGADLVAAGWRPGPGFGALLERARDAQLDGLVRTREEALGLLRGGPPVDESPPVP